MAVSTVFPISNVNSASNPSDSSSRIPQKSLGQADFLKLLTTQLAHQDPSKPMDDNSFIAQMAQFSTLQQNSQLVTDFAAFQKTQTFASASSLLGTQVTLNTANGDVSGTVSAVDASGDTPQLLLNDGKLYPYSSVKQVSMTNVPATTS
jgi:flagellar basal-body rod modification protein FlgD